MQIQAANPDDYIRKINELQKPGIVKLRNTINENIPQGFQETMSYGMIGWVVPHSLFPAGYHCDPKLPLPFASIAAQKNFIAVYHMGIYANPELLNWFVKAHAQHSSKKLDMGKSCIRYKKAEDIPYDLIGELMRKMSATDWISLYETEVKNARKKS